MVGEGGKRPEGFGRQPKEWERDLEGALEEGDHSELWSLLLNLRAELKGQADDLEEFDECPLLGRLVEQARRLVRAEPTDLEALEQEQQQERTLWADYRRRYRETFVPTEFHPFLRSSGVFLKPSYEGVQYRGFEKFFGTSSETTCEAVTLFRRVCAGRSEEGPPETPANFFSTYEVRYRRFVVERAFRMALPPGAGTDCLVEQVRALVPQVPDLREFVWDRVQNRPTYEAYVDTEGGSLRLRSELAAEDSVLGRVGLRILDRLGLQVAQCRPELDGFGFLDLILVVRRD